MYSSAPPSTTIFAPVIYLALSDARKATTPPISPGSPNFRMAIFCLIRSLVPGSITLKVSVAIHPGLTALAVIPYLAPSKATVFINDTRAPLLDA